MALRQLGHEVRDCPAKLAVSARWFRKRRNLLILILILILFLIYSCFYFVWTISFVTSFMCFHLLSLSQCRDHCHRGVHPSAECFITAEKGGVARTKISGIARTPPNHKWHKWRLCARSDMKSGKKDCLATPPAGAVQVANSYSTSTPER